MPHDYFIELLDEKDGLVAQANLPTTVVTTNKVDTAEKYRRPTLLNKCVAWSPSMLPRFRPGLCSPR